MKVATGIIIGSQPTADLAAEAVSIAMQKADISIANSVLLLLTSEFAGSPQSAIRAAAKSANCMQVMGCSATGIFTEEDWVLDAPAAAAMVFADDITLQLPQFNSDKQPLLTLSAPNAINSTWLRDGNIRYGGVSGDAIGQGPFSVWQNAKGDVTGCVEAFLSGANVVTKASHGLSRICQPISIVQTDGFDLVQLQQIQNPFLALHKAWNSHNKTNEPIPLHLVIAIYADTAEGIEQGNYHQTTVISHDDDSGAITLAKALKPGQYLSWAIRDKRTAEADMLITGKELAEQLGCTPDFGLLFSCLGRGPYFYDGIDSDLCVIKQEFPRMPLIGFYGNGEIAYVNGVNQLLPYSAVLSLYSARHGEY